VKVVRALIISSAVIITTEYHKKDQDARNQAAIPRGQKILP
jgi:hypothetical protein